MIKTTTQLAKDLHRRMGYPLGKVHYRVQLFGEMLKSYGSPMRHVRRISFQARHLPDVLRRKRKARDLASNSNPEIVNRARELRAQGFAYINELIDPQLLRELVTYYDEVLSKRSDEAHAIASHPFFFPLADSKDFNTDNILVRFALQEAVVKVVTAYFGSVPTLGGISVLESRSVKIEKKSLLASQQWHLDYTKKGDDFVSVWVYLTDVLTPDQGPLTLISKPESLKVKNTFFPRRIEDEEIEAAGLTGKIERLIGPRTTAFLVNTNKCYHMGSRLKEGEKRVVCILSFYRSEDDLNIVNITSPVSEDEELLLRR